MPGQVPKNNDLRELIESFQFHSVEFKLVGRISDDLH